MLNSTRRRTLIATVAAGICSLAFAGPAHANQVVDDLDDVVSVGVTDGVCDADEAPGGEGCTLREAVREANATAGHETITFSVTGVHPMTIGQLNPTEPVTIDGNGSGTGGTVIDGTDSFRLFLMLAGVDVTLKDIRLQDGGIVNPAGDGGAAVRTSSDLTLNNVTVTSNQLTGTGPGLGAGINVISSDPLTVTNSTISSNTISTSGSNGGAGIAALGTVNLTNTAVSGNTITAGTGAGGGVNAAGDFTLDRSSLSGNTLVTGPGAGLFAGGAAGIRSVSNSTISGNTTDNTGGGGLHLSQGATLTNVTFAQNSGGSGAGEGDDLEITNGNAVAQNSIFASADPCNASGGTIISAVPGHNIDEGMSCGFGTADGNMEDTDPLVFFTQAGDPLQTLFIPLATSPAIDNADPGCGGGLTLDNRGVDRPQGLICDIGAFERDYRDLNVSVAGGGTVSGTGINCVNGGGDCFHEFLDGGPGFVLTATPAAGFQFSSWTAIGGGCSSITGNQCTVDTGNDRTITATFTALPPSGGGITTTPATPTTPTAPSTSTKKCKKKKKGKKTAGAAKKCKKKKKK